MKKIQNKKFLGSIIIVFLILIGVAVIRIYTNSEYIKIQNKDKKNALVPTNNSNDSNQKKLNNKDINILAVGDILIHKEILASQLNKSTNTYDFNNNFSFVKKYIEEADLSICNLETTLSGNENGGYSGYPNFNSPDSLADAIKNSGFDVVNTINNHSLDKGDKGFIKTQSTVKDKLLDVIGTRNSESDKRYIIKDIKDVKFGIIGYSFSTSSKKKNTRGLNQIPIPDELFPLMNTFNPESVDNDLLNMKKQIEEMKKDGAQIIVFYIHWGDEYKIEPNNLQKKIANSLNSYGVDIIFGTHPHTVQPIDIITSKDSKNKTVVVYSMGNFISSQRQERDNGNPYTEDGLIVNITIARDTNNKLTVKDVAYIPTWVNWFPKDGKYVYEILPINDFLNNNNIPIKTQERVKQSYDRTLGIINSLNTDVKQYKK